MCRPFDIEKTAQLDERVTAEYDQQDGLDNRKVEWEIE